MPALSADSVQISVIICTRNRAEQLRQVLDSAAAMDVPPDLSWELLVIDNGSSDHTPEVIESFAERLPIRRVSEPQAGLSNARNRGVAEARGSYICWTDDDVLIDLHWLSAYAEAFVRHPEVAYFGGPIDLVLEGPTPSWLEANRGLLGPMLAERQLGDKPILFDPTVEILPYGANYAVRANEQHLHQYDPNLGVSPNQRRVGEETTLLAALHRRGFKGLWVPEARVLHVIPAERQTLQSFFDLQRSIGESAAYLARRKSPDLLRRSMQLRSWEAGGAPLHLRCLMVGHLVRSHLLRLLGSHSWLPDWLKYGFYRGAIDFWRADSRRESSK
jgi:hypothetical protein